MVFDFACLLKDTLSGSMPDTGTLSSRKKKDQSAQLCLITKHRWQKLQCTWKCNPEEQLNSLQAECICSALLKTRPKIPQVEYLNTQTLKVKQTIWKSPDCSSIREAVGNYATKSIKIIFSRVQLILILTDLLVQMKNEGDFNSVEVPKSQ